MRMAPKRPQVAMPSAADPMNPRALGVQGATGGPKPAPVRPLGQAAAGGPQPAPMPRGMPQQMADRLGGMRPPVGGMRTPQPAVMKKGGKVVSASKRADGIAKKGKTKGRIV